MPPHFQIDWRDAGREPQCAPHPEYPNGIDLDMSQGQEATCTVALPYPAKRCGIYTVQCGLCGIRVGCTTAGRPDDPRSVKVPCILQGGVTN
jgi:hypothetical protein